jgi:serine/threonine protein kinase
MDNYTSGGNDHTFLTNTGLTFEITDTLLGHGSYGDVYLAYDENKKQLAVKCCNLEASGIPNILEASIMSSISHPYLNRALRIQASDKKLYIIQELAVTDLAQYTRRDKKNYKPSLQELQKWCYSLCHAVFALHNENIIHADIKANNVLLYADGTVKLTDYTLATKKWSPGDKFTHNVCTCTHRPLECYLRQSWDESLDIWALGCTLYEIAYGELLFPYQGSIESIVSNATKGKKDAKIRLRNRTMNVLIDWAKRGPNSSVDNTTLGATQYQIDYIPYVFCEEFYKPEMGMFNNLLLRMLHTNPSRRPSINEILTHPFFISCIPPMYLSIRRPMNQITIEEQARVSRHIQRCTNDTTAQSLAMNIYCRCNDLVLDEKVKAMVATWIAAKIIIGYPPNIQELPTYQILGAERDICHNLLFRLHH